MKPSGTGHDAAASETMRSDGKRQRIAKLMARAGLCSRRDAEAWIVAGRVSVNDEVLTSPAVDVASDDKILVDGDPLPALDKTRLFLFHKPRGLVTSDHDPDGRETVAGFLREHWPEGPRVVTVGRLDINTEGLLLLTNDGGLARVLELPQTGWVRRYKVRAKGTADPAALDALAGGITVDGIDYAGIEAKLDRVQGANVWLTMGLREGKNREIKRVLEHMGLEVNRLIRLSFGPFQLLELPEGAVEEVRTRVLRDQLGTKLAAQAGAAFGDTPPLAAAQPATSRSRPPDRRPGERKARQDKQPARAERNRRAEASSGNDRHGRRREPMPGSAPRRERPIRGTRKHVSALRAESADATGTAQWTRIERSSTHDRRDRKVSVERIVRPPTGERETRRARSSSGEAAAERSRPASAARVEQDRQRSRPQPARRVGGDRPRSDGGQRTAGGRRHASPSAEGKRERIARSGPRSDAPPFRKSRRQDDSPNGTSRQPSGQKRRPHKNTSTDYPSRREERDGEPSHKTRPSRTRPSGKRPHNGPSSNSGRRGPPKPKR